MGEGTRRRTPHIGYYPHSTYFTSDVTAHTHQFLLQRLDTLLVNLHASQAFSKEALVDLLKTCFNLILQYPRFIEAANELKLEEEGKGKNKEAAADKVLGELWDDKFGVYVSSPQHFSAYMWLDNHRLPP